MQRVVEFRQKIQAGGRAWVEAQLAESRDPTDAWWALTAAAEHPELLEVVVPRCTRDHLLQKLAEWAQQDVPAESLAALLRAGANPNKQPSNRPFPLASAAARGDVAKVKVLLAAGARPDHVELSSAPDCDDGEGPLVNAIRAGHLEVVRLLVEAGADLQKLTKKSRTPLEMAEALGREEIAAWLRTRGSAPPAPPSLDLYQAALRGEVAQVRALVASADEKERGKALWGAATANRVEVVLLLIEAGVPEKGHVSALCQAAARGHLQTLKALIALGVNVRAVGEPTGYTPLHWAANGGHAAAIRELVRAGAPVDVSSKGERSTPLHIAALNGKLEAVRALLALGANPNAIAADRSTPLSTAESRGHVEIAALLREAGASHQAKKDRFKALKDKLAPVARVAHRPSTKPGEGDPTGSRFGGRPWLPAGEAWPTSTSGRPMAFFAQIDLRSIPPKLQKELGKDGLLQVFAVTSGGPASLVRVVAPGEGGLAEPPEGVTLFPARYVTSWGRAVKDYPAGEVPAGIELDPIEAGLATELNLAGDKLGGWPTWIQEPVYPGKTDRLVLQLDSYCNVPHDWGDGGVAHVFRAGNDGELILEQQSA